MSSGHSGSHTLESIILSVSKKSKIFYSNKTTI